MILSYNLLLDMDAHVVQMIAGDGCMRMRIFAKQPIVWAGPLSFLYIRQGKSLVGYRTILESRVQGVKVSHLKDDIVRIRLSYPHDQLRRNDHLLFPAVDMRLDLIRIYSVFVR